MVGLAGVDTTTFGPVTKNEDFKSAAFSLVSATDLLFETDIEYAVYLDVSDGSPYQVFQSTVPLHNCGVDTEYEWAMSEGTMTDPDLCDTNLYIHPIDWEGGLIPCGDSESATGPAWSGRNKELGCPLNDPVGTSFVQDPWDLNPWGDRNPDVLNHPLRMWVR